MNQVWLFIKILEFVSGLFALAYHIFGSLHFAEPLPHNLIFCGTFGGYIFICMVTTWKLLKDYRTLLYPELLICSTSIIMHFLCGFLSMYYAEIDFHIQYMGPKQEMTHVFFYYCRHQSIASIWCGTIYLFHFVLVLDFILKMMPNDDTKELDQDLEMLSVLSSNGSMYATELERDYIARTEAYVYFLGPQVDSFLQRHLKCFRKLACSQKIEMKAPKWHHNTPYSSDSSTSMTITEIITTYNRSALNPSDDSNDFTLRPKTTEPTQGSEGSKASNKLQV